MLARSTARRQGDGRTSAKATSMRRTRPSCSSKFDGLMSRWARPASHSRRTMLGASSMTAPSIWASPSSTAPSKNLHTTRYSRSGVSRTTPYGVVLLTPEREYLVVCKFFDGAVELGDAQIDGAVIDDAPSIVRRLWDAGLAHRDIKPSNLLLHDGRVRLIDVAFAEV